MGGPPGGEQAEQLPSCEACGLSRMGIWGVLKGRRGRRLVKNSSSQATFTPRNTRMVSSTASTRSGRASTPRSATMPGTTATSAIRTYRTTAAT
jgi:hypothetical protein